MADAYMLLGGPPRGDMERARQAALRALTLDDDLSEGYVALASINWFYDWDWAAAERHYRRSFSVNRVRSTLALLPLTTLAGIYLADNRLAELREVLPELRAAGAAAATLTHFTARLDWHEGRRAQALVRMEAVELRMSAHESTARCSTTARTDRRSRGSAIRASTVSSCPPPATHGQHASVVAQPCPWQPRAGQNR
jgi:hypothetical protein